MNKSTMSSRELSIEESDSDDISRVSTMEDKPERAIEREAFGYPPYSHSIGKLNVLYVHTVGNCVK